MTQNGGRGRNQVTGASPNHAPLPSPDAYVASSAAPSHAAGDTVARDYRGTPRRSIAHERPGSRVRSRTLKSARVARDGAQTLEGALLSLMLSERIAARGLSTAASKLLAARELAELFGVPESWVREQARLGNLPSFKLGHYVRFRIEEVERFLTQRASQAA
jgi:excisionase family DNA binding protein